MNAVAAQAPGKRADGDTVLAVGLLVILAVLLIPLPQSLLDLLISANLGFALLILITVLRAKQPLEFSTFPSVLLFATLWRLSLNVASSRLILLEGDAGAVIHAFGGFVVGGNVFVGGVVFLILIVVQFVVITKGATRISEVAARFTLDALPGKQMAIDADLNAGHIREDEARARRAAVSREAEFHGAMDGASKFVRGDAVAGLLITAINILGGIIMGLTHGMGIGEALSKYAVLTIGDGLVTQIPALLVSIAAGVITVKSSSEATLSTDLSGELLARPGVLGTVAALVGVLALLPGLPKLPFFLVAGGAGALFLVRKKGEKTQAAEAAAAAAAAAAPVTSAPLDPAEVIKEALQLDRLSLGLGYALVPLADEAAGGTVIPRIALLRKQVAGEWGWPVPAVRVREDLGLPADGYRILVGGHEVAQGSLHPGRYMAIGPQEALRSLDGTPGTDPSFGLPAVWVREEDRAMAELRGCTVVDATSVLVTHLGEVVRGHAAELITRDDVQALLESLKKHSPATVSEAFPALVTLGEVQRVLAALLRERVPVRELGTILEALADQAPRGKDPTLLVEAARQRISRAVVAPHSDETGRLLVLTLEPRLERRLQDGFSPRAEAAAALDGAFLHALVEGIAAEVKKAAGRPGGREPVLVVQAGLRSRLAELLRSTLPRLAVLSYAELGGARRVESAGVVKTEGTA